MWISYVLRHKTLSKLLYNLWKRSIVILSWLQSIAHIRPSMSGPPLSSPAISVTPTHMNPAVVDSRLRPPVRYCPLLGRLQYTPRTASNPCYSILNHYRVAYYWLLCANMTSSIKLEVPNPSQRRQRKRELWTLVMSISNKIGRNWMYSSVDILAGRQTGRETSQYTAPISGTD